jgi:hypothetical protein
MPVLLRNITRGLIETERWAEVVAEYDTPVALGDAVRTSDANVVVVGDAPDVERQATSLLEQERRVGVLAISEDGRQTVLYELRPNKELLGEVSAELLVHAIRNAVSPPVEA